MSKNVIARREAQLHGYFILMRQRLEMGSNCFIIFTEHEPTEKRKSSLPPGMAFVNEPGSQTSAPLVRTIKDSFNHYIQYCFDEDEFRVDLPEQTLHPDEAERLLTEREGFFYVRDVQEVSESLRSLNPLQKVYTYGQERLAAADMIFLLLEVWNIPADFCWYVKAARFEGAERWEWGEPMA